MLSIDQKGEPTACFDRFLGASQGIGRGDSNVGGPSSDETNLQSVIAGVT